MKNTILIILSSLIFLFIVFVAIFGIYDIPKQMENDAEKILSKISKDLSMGDLKKETVDNLPKDFFYLIWIKNQKGSFVPLVYDKKISFHVENSPLIPLDGLSKKTKVFKKNIFKFEYIVWINKFKIDYYVKNILIPILFIVIVYLILSIVFSFIFVGKKEIIVEKEKSFEDDEPMSYELSTEEFEGLLGDQKGDEEDEIYVETKEIDDKGEHTEENILEVKDRNFNDKILSDYKELWIKHFKISEDFKINFPFEKIYNLLKFGVTPELYIKEALNASSEYFKWKKPEIYINQEDKFVDCVSKNFLNDEIIDIPVKGDKKGRNFIPLYPYNRNTIFGYLSFEWNETCNFMIADILYFLKFLFSEDAKKIFLNYKENENIILEFKNLFAKKKCFFCLIEVDDKEDLKMKMKKNQSDNINLMIFDNFKNDFKNCGVYSIFKFYYCVFGEYEDINSIINFIEDCVTDYDKHNYKISAEEGNAAVTFSVGLSYKSQDDDISDNLINQALNNLRIAIIQGGNQIVS